MPPWEEPFLETELYGPSYNLQSTIAVCSCCTILTRLKHCRLQYHIWELRTSIIKETQVRETVKDSLTKPTVWQTDYILISHWSQTQLHLRLTRDQRIVFPFRHKSTEFTGNHDLSWQTLNLSAGLFKTWREHKILLNTCCLQVWIIHWDFLSTEQSKLI